jgi:hypothetical protein
MERLITPTKKLSGIGAGTPWVQFRLLAIREIDLPLARHRLPLDRVGGGGGIVETTPVIMTNT